MSRAVRSPAAALLWLVAGCGSADQTRIEPEEAPTEEPVDVNGHVNLCPRFTGSLIVPQSIAPGQTAVVVARAADPDGDDSALTYDWSASAGTLIEVDGPLAKYSCTDSGPQLLTVVTQDERGCHAKLEIQVSCTPM